MTPRPRPALVLQGRAPPSHEQVLPFDIPWLWTAVWTAPAKILFPRGTLSEYTGTSRVVQVPVADKRQGPDPPVSSPWTEAPTSSSRAGSGAGRASEQVFHLPAPGHHRGALSGSYSRPIPKNVCRWEAGIHLFRFSADPNIGPTWRASSLEPVLLQCLLALADPSCAEQGVRHCGGQKHLCPYRGR